MELYFQSFFILALYSTSGFIVTSAYCGPKYFVLSYSFLIICNMDMCTDKTWPCMRTSILKDTRCLFHTTAKGKE